MKTYKQFIAEMKTSNELSEVDVQELFMSGDLNTDEQEKLKKKLPTVSIKDLEDDDRDWEVGDILFTDKHYLVVERLRDKMTGKSDEELNKVYQQFGIDIDEFDVVKDFDDLIEGGVFLAIDHHRSTRQVKVISDDFTGMERPIKYLIYDLNKHKDEFVSSMNNNSILPGSFALWDHDFGRYLFFKPKQELIEGLRDKMVGVSIDDIKKKISTMETSKKLHFVRRYKLPVGSYEEYEDEFTKYMDGTDVSRVTEMRKQSGLEYRPHDFIVSEILNGVWEDDLNEALIIIQELIGQEHGDVASVFFSYDDAEGDWERKAEIERRILIFDYIFVEWNDVDFDYLHESLRDKMTPVSREEAMDNMDNFLRTIVERYEDEVDEKGNTIKEMDVMIIPDLMDAIKTVYELSTNEQLGHFLGGKGILYDFSEILDIANDVRSGDDGYIGDLIEDVLQDGRDEHIFSLIELLKKKN